MAALARDARRFEAGGASADDGNLPAGASSAGDDMRCRGLTSRRRIVDAQCVIPLIETVDAVGGADARANFGLAPLGDLADDMGVGNMGARHAHHIELAFGDRMACGRDITDARRMEDRELGQSPDFAGKIEMRRSLHAHYRDHFDKRRIMLDMAADDVEEVDEAGILQLVADLKTFRLGEALVPILIGDEPAADDEIGADGFAHRLEHAHGEAQAIVDRAIIGILAQIGRRAPEGVHQMAVAFELEAIEAGRLHALGRRGIIGDDALDVPILHLLGKGPMRRLADRRGGENREPVGLVPVGPAAEMGELDHHGCAVLMAFIGKLGEPRHDLVLVGEQIAESGRRIARDDG